MQKFTLFLILSNAGTRRRIAWQRSLYCGYKLGIQTRVNGPLFFARCSQQTLANNELGRKVTLERRLSRARTRSLSAVYFSTTLLMSKMSEANDQDSTDTWRGKHCVLHYWPYNRSRTYLILKLFQIFFWNDLCRVNNHDEQLLL